jgi:hypothetical protein
MGPKIVFSRFVDLLADGNTWGWGVTDSQCERPVIHGEELGRADCAWSGWRCDAY